MTDDPRVQFFTFVNLVIDTPYLNLMMHELIEKRELQIIPLTPTDFFLDNVPEKYKPVSEDLALYLKESLEVFRSRFKSRRGYSPTDLLLIEELEGFCQNFENDVPISDIDSAPEQVAIPAIPLIATKQRGHRDQGIFQFIAACTETNKITSSVDLYSTYVRWCMENGFGPSSSPTLTKYLRDSEKKDTESLSEKGRSQGWLLLPPDLKNKYNE